MKHYRVLHTPVGAAIEWATARRFSENLASGAVHAAGVERTSLAGRFRTRRKSRFEPFHAGTEPGTELNNRGHAEVNFRIRNQTNLVNRLTATSSKITNISWWELLVNHRWIWCRRDVLNNSLHSYRNIINGDKSIWIAPHVTFFLQNSQENPD